MQEQDASLERARELAGTARQALSQGAFQLAYDTATEAIEAMGMTYYDPRVIDDTSMRQFAARDLLQQGNLEQAAVMVSGVLDERLAIHDAKEAPGGGSAGVCPNCGSPTSPEARFCSRCGQQLVT